MVRFHGAVYDPEVLNSLRHHARFYLHGHSAGGTNPSLLEAMACGCRILAHDNPYNRDVLQGNAGYFATEDQLSVRLGTAPDPGFDRSWKENNLAAIRNHYEWNLITNEYESAFFHVLEQ